MEGRRGRGRPRTRSRGPAQDLPIEPAASRAETGPAGPAVPGVVQDRDRALDERLIATYESCRQAERREAVPEVQRGPPEEFRRLYDSFMRLNPPRFDGAGEYAVAEEWLANMNAKLILCRAPEEDMVELAEQQLESGARFWWDGARRGYAGEEVKIPWGWFEQQFTRRFLSNLQREALRRQFLDLRQNGRPVAEYNNEFLALSRYAPDVQRDVVRYHRQYLDGLDGGISMIVDTPAATELQAMMDHAAQVELHSKRRKAQMTERNVKQREDHNRQTVRSGGGPSTARPPPRRTTTPGFGQSVGSDWCTACNHAHSQQDCRRRNRACFTCGSLEHWARECPRNAVGFQKGSDARGPAGRGQSGPPSRGRGTPQHSGGRTGGRVSAHALGISEVAHDAAGTQAEVMTGILSISDHDAYCLIDTGCSHSIVSKTLVEKCNWPTETGNQVLSVQTPFGSTDRTITTCRNRKVRVDGRDLEIDMLVMEITGYDVLLGMDWLTRHAATIDCPHRRICFATAKGSMSCLLNCRKIGGLMPCISSMEVRRLMDSGCNAYLASIVYTTTEVPEITTIPVVSEFVDVFPEEIVGLPPEREVEFGMELVPGTMPISKNPYRMAPAELKELKA